MLEAKLKELEVSLRFLCISKDELLEYLLKEKGFSLESLPLEGWRSYPVVNSNFDVNDIRSRVELGWYAFAGGHFSPNKDEYPNCQGVVGFINDNPYAVKGNLVKVVLRHQKELQWSHEQFHTGVVNNYNGKENTRRLLEYGREKGVMLPAMKFAANYTFDGVKVGEAYVPARDELKELIKNFNIINCALKQIGSSFDGWHWSSSEYSTFYTWVVEYGEGVGYGDKTESTAVSCLLAY